VRIIFYFDRNILVVLFNAGCNELVFSPKSWKKLLVNPSCRFHEKRKL